MTRTETMYSAILVGTVGASIWSLSSLFQKYTVTTANQLAAQCYQALGSFFSSSYHVLGISIFGLTIASALFLLLRVLSSTWKTQRKMAGFASERVEQLPSAVVTMCQKYQLPQRHFIVTTHQQPLAFTIGFFQPRIIISTGMIQAITTSELAAVMLHEYHHLRHHHGALLLISEIISSTVFVLPILKDLQQDMKAVFEYQADQAATAAQRTSTHVVSALEKLLKTPAEPTLFPAFALLQTPLRVASLRGRYRHQLHLNGQRVITSLTTVVGLLVLLSIPAPSPVQANTVITNNPKDCQTGQQCVINCQPQPSLLDLQSSWKNAPLQFSTIGN